MNLFASGPDAPNFLSLVSAGWKIEVVAVRASDFGNRYTAVVSRAGEELCHITIDPVIGGDQEAHRRLAERARQWIADFQYLDPS